MAEQSPKRRPNLKPMDLMATTAHELKSPLVLINGLAEMLEAGQFGELTSRQSKYIQRIDSASERLLGMVENLLLINRSQHGRLNLELEPIAIGPVLENIISELQPRIRQNKMTVIWSPHLLLPPVLGDKHLIQQIFYNLLDNAIKYSNPKSSVTIKFRLQPSRLTAVVQDNGLGIRPSDLDHLFARFGNFRKPIGGQGSSSGLGLFIVKNLVESLGGQISAKRLKRGTQFSVSLPTIRQLELFTPLENEENSKV